MKMTMIMNKFEIEAWNVKEALVKAEDQLGGPVSDCTSKFISEKPSDISEWAYNTFNGSPAYSGILIELNAPIPNKRKNPTKITKNVLSKGAPIKTRVFEVRETDTNILLKVVAKRSEAVTFMKEYIKSNKVGCYCQQAIMIDDNHKRIFEGIYNPSKDAKLGRYVVFHE